MFSSNNLEAYSIVDSLSFQTTIITCGLINPAVLPIIHRILAFTGKYSGFKFISDDWTESDINSPISVSFACIDFSGELLTRAMNPEKTEFKDWYAKVIVVQEKRFESERCPALNQSLDSIGDYSYCACIFQAYYGGRYIWRKPIDPIPRISNGFKRYYKIMGSEDRPIGRFTEFLRNRNISYSKDTIFPDIIIIMGNIPSKDAYWAPKRISSLCTRLVDITGLTIKLIEFDKPMDIKKCVPVQATVDLDTGASIRTFKAGQPIMTQGPIRFLKWEI